MNKAPWYKSPEMIVGLSALTVSLVAVFVGVYSAYIDRAYARASVWPRLEVYRSDFSDDKFKKFRYGVTNSGTGPAKIEYVKVQYGSKTIKNWVELFSKEELAELQFIQSHLNGRVIPSQNIVEPLIVIEQNNREVFNEFKKTKIDLVNIEICYCSIYDECWATDSKNNSPSEASSCSAQKGEEFLQ